MLAASWTPVALVAVLIPAACGTQETSAPLQVVSWSGDDGRPVALDQILKVEFDRPLAGPVRASSVELVDEGDFPLPGISLTVVGRWLHLTPRLPLRADLSDGSLAPDRSYGIHLHGLPWLRALSSADGRILPQDLILRFRTVDAESSGALAGLGVESSALRLVGPVGREPLAFRSDQPVLLSFTRGLDPRSLRHPAAWQAQGGAAAEEVSLRLVDNRYDGAVVEVLLGDWEGWGILELPPGIEGLGGWPLPEGDRKLQLVRRSREPRGR